VELQSTWVPTVRELKPRLTLDTSIEQIQGEIFQPHPTQIGTFGTNNAHNSKQEGGKCAGKCGVFIEGPGDVNCALKGDVMIAWSQDLVNKFHCARCGQVRFGPSLKVSEINRYRRICNNC
jgi:hypothetical protein